MDRDEPAERAHAACSVAPALSAAETELLLACARTARGTVADRIGELLAGSIDWDALLAAADHHQVTGLVAATLCGGFAPRCPPEAIERLHQALRALAARNLLLARRFTELLQALAADGIRVIAYKGPVLAQAVYGNLALRQFSDLDVLVSPWDYHRGVDERLGADGWRVVSDQGYERTYESVDGGLRLDVHLTVSPRREMPFALGFGPAWRRTVEVPLAAGRARTFAPEDLLLVLCMQLAKDAGERRRPPALAKLCDIAELLRHRPAMDWRALRRRARALGVQRILWLGVDAAGALLDAPSPAGPSAPPAPPPEIAQPLALHLRQRILGPSPGGYAHPELLDPGRWHWLLRERLRDRCEPLRALSGHALPPSAYDYAAVRLPRALSPLYWLVRPLRLAWRYGPGRIGGSGSPRAR